MGCESCARAVLLAFNLIFFLVGGAALGIGIWVLVDGTIFLELLANIPDSGAYGKLIADAAYVFIAAGAGIFILAFLGCCGAWKRNKCMLITYAIIVGLFILMEIAVVVIAVVFSDQVMEVLKVKAAAALGGGYASTFTLTSGSTYTYASSDMLSKAIDALQIKFSCCGVNGYGDYNYTASDPRWAPITCCKTTSSGADLDTLVNSIWGGSGSITIDDAACPTTQTTVANIKGCYDSVYSYLMARSTIVMAVGGGILGVQVFLIVFACCVACRSEKDDD